jgi:putative transposase
MKYNSEIHHRQSIRLKGYDYSRMGAYFVTIRTHGRECLFGEVADGGMRLNHIGEVVQAIWTGLPKRFSNVMMDEYMVMPNHFHGIIVTVGAPLAASGFESKSENQGGAEQGAASGAGHFAEQGAASSAPTIGKIIRAFKSISAVNVNRLLDRQGVPVWQRNYYDRIIRDEGELNAVRKYILDNPIKWGEDEDNPVVT